MLSTCGRMSDATTTASTCKTEAIMYESSVIQHFAEQGLEQGRERMLREDVRTVRNVSN